MVIGLRVHIGEVNWVISLQYFCQFRRNYLLSFTGIASGERGPWCLRSPTSWLWKEIPDMPESLLLNLLWVRFKVPHFLQLSV